jgi:hypothetical protein
MRGIVRQGRIEITEGPPLPEGAVVELEVASVAAPEGDPALAFFGLWRAREDLGDSSEFVLRMRQVEWQR